MSMPERAPSSANDGDQPRVFLASCSQLPEPDVDEAILVEALTRAGLRAEVRAWDDPEVPWAEARLVVLRSTWNYFEHVEAFVAWARSVAERTRLLNPAAIVTWNSHKRYLGDLAARGFPIVPTAHVRRGESGSLAAIAAAHGFQDVVVKPAVSAGSFATRRFRAGDLEAGEAFLAEMSRERDVMVQPYMRSVEDDGERAIVCIDGELMHAVRKSPRFSGDAESVSAAQAIRDDERALAESVLRAMDAQAKAMAGGGPLLYARVDVARGEDGRPRIMELELIEPSLFLAKNPAALERFTRAIAAQAR